MHVDIDRLLAGRWSLLHSGRNRTKADVHAVEVDGRRYAVKDYTSCAWPIRLTVGRLSLRREERAYQALAGVEGVPGFAGRPTPYTLVTELVEATSLAAWGRERALPQGFFRRLKGLVEEVHRAGVVQGDLHHRDVLIGTAGQAWLVDFSTSLSGGPQGNPLRRRLWRMLARQDRRAVLKLQERYEPGTLTEEEAGAVAVQPVVYRWGKRLRRLLRGR